MHAPHGKNSVNFPLKPEGTNKTKKRYGRNYFAKKKQTTEAAFNDLKMIQAIAKTMTRPFPSSFGGFFRKSCRW